MNIWWMDLLCSGNVTMQISGKWKDETINNGDSTACYARPIRQLI